MDIGQVFGGDSLKAADLNGSEPTVVIQNVEMKKFDNGNKLVISFRGKKKSLVCNKTNANRIAYAYGTNTENWIGQEITLFTDLVDFQGNTVEAIRVRAKKPARNNADNGFDDDAPAARGSLKEQDPNDQVPF